MAHSWVIALLLTLTSFTSLTSAYIVHGSRPRNNASSSTDALFDRRAGPNPADFSWIKKWAAIGDSFTAGIGSGNLYSRERGDIKCSRYDHAYPAIINRALGPSVQDFQFAACSGDRSVQIFEQVSNMKASQDLVMMTAGGNDLCLVHHAPHYLRIGETLALTAHILCLGWYHKDLYLFTLSGRGEVPGNPQQSTGEY